MESSICGVCGELLVPNERNTPLTCCFCGKGFSSPEYCPQGHNACEDCAKLDPATALILVISKTGSKSPAEILEKAISHPSVTMHGPAHHFIVPAVIVAAAANAGYVNKNLLTSAIERGMRVPGGW